MAHYQLFIPGVQGSNNEHLVKRGLGDLLGPGSGPEWMDVIQNGPGGKAGLLACWRTGVQEMDGEFGYNGDTQIWQPMVDKPGFRETEGEVWIGWEKENPPRPFEMIRDRKNVHAGNEVQLADGQMWVIPEAMLLDSTIKLMPGGHVGLQVTEEFEAFCTRANSYASLVSEKILCLAESDKDSIDYKLKDAFPFACEAIGLNYRVNTEVVSHLDLLTEKHAAAVILNVISAPAILEMRDKKKGGEKLSIPVG